MDDDPEPFDPQTSAVAAAQAQLEVARRSGRTAAIAWAMLNLGVTLAAVGDHRAAVPEYEALIDYLELAGRDVAGAEQRQLRMLSPAAPPPGPDDIDPVAVQAAARIQLAESLLALGRRDEARSRLEEAGPGTKGWGKGPLRRRLAQVRRQLDAAARVPTSTESVAEQPGLLEQVAAADELLADGRAQDSARLALAAIARCTEDDVLERAKARQVLGMALDELGQHQDALAVLQQAYQDYLAADDVAAAAHVAVALAWRLSEQGRDRDAAELLRGTLHRVEGRLGPQVRVRLLVDLASVLDRDADTRGDARTTMQAAVGTASAAADRELAADAQHGLAIVLTHSSDKDDLVEALSLLDDCRRTYEELGHADRAAGCEHEAASLLGRLGSYEPAAARYRKALDRYQHLPEPLRDTGSWPDEVADCEANLAALASAGAPGSLAGDPRLFRSGGHAMSHRP